MYLFLKKLEEALKSHLKETYLPPHRAKTPGWTHHDLVFFAKGADKVSTAFTEERSFLPKNYFNQKEFRSAYLLYFVLLNAAKVWKCLEERCLALLGEGPQKCLAPFRILDLGSGPGTASLACSSFFQNIPLEITAVDQNVHAIRDAMGLWKRMNPPANHRLNAKTVDLHPKNIERFLKGTRFDLVIAANFLSEMPFEKQVDLSAQILKHARKLILIEPALRQTTRDLQRLRDELVARKEGEVLAPCLHQQNCPMLAFNKRDWCHFYIEWKCPLLIRQVDQLIGNRHDYLKMAYMIMCHPKRSEGSPHFYLGDPSASPQDDAQRRNDIWRTVSSPMGSKGKKELILCGDCGKLKKIERLNKDRSQINLPFDDIRRGDIVQWPPKTRVGREDPVKILKKF